MFVLSNLLTACAQVLDVVINILWWAILIRALISWVNPDPFNPIVIALHRVTEPLLAPFRRILPAHSIGIDFAPLLAMLALLFIRAFLIKSLYDIAYQIR